VQSQFASNFFSQVARCTAVAPELSRCVENRSAADADTAAQGLVTVARIYEVSEDTMTLLGCDVIAPLLDLARRIKVDFPMGSADAALRVETK
jgi:hypothetical protein